MHNTRNSEDIVYSLQKYKVQRDKMYIMLKSFRTYNNPNIKEIENYFKEALKEQGLKDETIKRFIKGTITEDSLATYIKKIENGISFTTVDKEGNEVEDKKGNLIFDVYYPIRDKFSRKYSFEEDTNLSRKEGRDNRIFDIQWAVLTNSDTMTEMFNPGSFDVPKKTARIVNLLKSNKKYSYKELSKLSLNELDKMLESSSNRNIIFSGTQVYFHKQNMTAGKLIGIFANNNTSHAFLSMQNIKLNLPEGFMFNGVLISNDNEDSIKLDKIVSRDGTLISKNIASFLAASVDAVKDPVLNNLNLNTFTCNVAMVLARLGFDTDSIGLFLTQPIIESITREYFKRNNEGYISGEDIINEVLKDMFDDIDLEKSLSTTPFTKEDLAEGLLDRENSDFQASVLTLFKKLFSIGQDLNTLTFLTKFNSVTNAVGPTIADTLVMRERYNKFIDKMENEEEAPFNKEAINVIQNSPILDAFYSTTVADGGASDLIFSNYFPHYSGNFTMLLNVLRKNIKGQLDSKVINKLANEYILYKLTLGNNPIIDSSIENRNKLINKFPEEFKEITADIINNELLTVINNKSKTKKCPVPTLEAKTGSYSADLQERIKNSWGDLMLNPDTKDLGIDLFIYNIFRSGFNFSPKSFGHLASVDVKINIPGYVETLRDIEFNDDLVGIEDFMYMFLRNHTNEYKLIPRVEDTKHSITKGTNVKGDNIITIKNKDLIKSITTDNNGKVKTYSPIIMFNEKLYGFPKEIGKNTLEYKEITALGNPNNFVEYGPEGATLKSVINSDISEISEEPDTTVIPNKDAIEDSSTSKEEITFIKNVNKILDKNEKLISSLIENSKMSNKNKSNLITAILGKLGKDSDNDTLRKIVRNQVNDKIKKLC